MAVVIAPIGEWWPLVLLVALFGVGCLVTVPRYWRGDTGYLRRERPPGVWPFGVSSWKGFVRASPAFTGMMLVASIAFLIPAIFLGPRVSTSWRIYGLLTLAFLVLVIAVTLSITLFNRPRFLVPPPWRDEPGALTRPT